MGDTQHIGSTPERTMAGLIARLERTRHALEQRVAVGTADMRLLWLLSDGRARTLREICEALRLEQSTVHRQVANAHAQGLVVKHKRDGSSAWHVEATDAGLRAFEEALTEAMQITGAGLDRLDAAEQDTLLDLLSRFLVGYTEAVADAPVDAPR
ncbi:MarR family winged helix-turn-helix transcriptional regulator [Demequina sp. NBRC 110057]|uniref:MarR family winged helix-turn-helix transcriptional regulator n=1 Tax=Demequina sp. NBRC 110057 TaxID=1570346 RepID=UPI000A00187A|nr:MarR family winged helix-turn-helix transcriptional regulator [Demequina sp. NBRC 110057]